MAARLPGDGSKHWNKALSRPLDLTGGPGGTLRSLQEARDLFTLHFASRTRIELAAIERLRHAAETGKATDIEAATDRIEAVLRARGWI